MNNREKYLPCSDWLFYKIYVSKDFADEIVIKINDYFVKSIDFDDKNLWFFIRYSDPKFHIRIRISKLGNSKFDNLTDDINQILTPYFNSNIVWKAEIGSYIRELDRYYNENIIESELIFHIDSTAIAKIIKCFFADKSHMPSRWIISIYLIEDLFKLFRYSISEKINLLGRLVNSFEKEFNVEKSFNREFSKLFSNLERPMINCLPIEISKILSERYLEIEKVIPIIQKRIDNLQINKDSLISSFIHMTANRIFVCNPRFQELVVYKYLYRYHITNQAKS